MNQLDFINSMTGNLSWPVTVIILAYMLRKPLSKILLTLRKFRVKDIELDFDKTIESIQKDMGNSKTIDWKITSTKHLESNMKWLVEKSPLGVVLQSWDIFESTIIKIAEKESGQPFRNASSAVIWIDENYKELDIVNLYYRLFSIKTKVSNFENEELPKERALELSDTILSVANKAEEYVHNKSLNQIGAKDAPPG